ncbi:16S rRNA (uracil1498-N3)-methyltransferase [Nitratiruptor sp. YY08-26]|uniref:16S rRNA (uracil(1498)-N(3))-methyltransferase n=1 Tax=unclassified Nitratiruptor TaxID=2624044 RepID=UPI0019162EE0|nr:MULTISPECIES: 16S rRNA (uracil(1498)-N(3))-methyltransferase [unclassified Nitratiruptor]BCD62902.1 16S rRNA (uracil1498-N3)-methyltransferase [Nitratiruptor sp. YY08-13]BCD66837.1 16S rRNA (uracil1498-N3)-methyltransferase [Nitratiruptor sp. YY08-26]
MQFLYHPKAGVEFLDIEGEAFTYLFKVRRHRKGEIVALRNMEDGYLYTYKIDAISRKNATLTLVHKEHKEILPKRFVHLLWGVIEPKVIEKTLPSLNELGVGRISFVYCARSQKNFKIRLDKLKKILINSCQQCGRSSLMEIETIDSFEEAMQKYSDTVLIDFSENYLQCGESIQRVFIGPEGGFSEEERKIATQIKGLDTPLILRSETAAVAVGSVLML